MSTGPLNSTVPPNAPTTAGVYNSVPPTPLDGQSVALQTDSAGNLKVVTSSSPGSSQDVNIAKIVGAAPALSNALPVELSDGSNAVGTSSNPLRVSASEETSTVYNGLTALTPLFATIVASSSGVTNIIALVSAKRIRVLALQLVANAAVNVKWQSHVTPTDLTGLAYLAANGGYVLPFNPLGWFQTVAGEALDINLSTAVAVGGSLTYVTV